MSKLDVIEKYISEYHYIPQVSYRPFMHKAFVVDMDAALGVDRVLDVFDDFGVRIVKRVKYISPDFKYAWNEYYFRGDEGRFAQAVKLLTRKALLVPEYSDYEEERDVMILNILQSNREFR